MTSPRTNASANALRVALAIAIGLVAVAVLAYPAPTGFAMGEATSASGVLSSLRPGNRVPRAPTTMSIASG